MAAGQIGNEDIMRDGAGAQAGGGVDRSIAANAEKYDAIPYTSKPFPQTHPVRLAGIARMFGLDVAPMAGARILEIGCASGGNLIPLAATYPDAQFVGIDISPRQVEDANQRIARLGLKNIRIACQSLTEFGPEEGLFDHIIAHGVHSWVPEPVQEALMQVCRQNLSDRGLAYVSYNVLPGWRLWQTLRDAFLLMIPRQHDEATRVVMARDLMEFMRDHTPDKSPYGDVLRSAHDRMKGLPDDYVAHEYLEDANIPMSFRDFSNQADRHGLAYLGEADFHLMFPANHGAGFSRQILDRTTSDIISIEQMLDVMTGRTFRQTIMVAKERQASITRKVTPEALAGIHYLPQADMRIEREGAEARLVDPVGRVLGSNRPAVITALERLLDAFPGSISLEACAAGADAQGFAEVRDALFRMTVFGMLHPCSEPIRCGQIGARPRAIAVARSDIAAGWKETVNLRHDPVAIDPASAAVLKAMDGSRTRRDLEKALLDAVRGGEVTFTVDGRPETQPAAQRRIVEELFPGMLESLRRCALIEP